MFDTVKDKMLFQKLSDDRPEIRKEAQDRATDYIQIRQREDGIIRRLFNFTELSDTEIDRQLHTDEPIKIIDLALDSAGAYSLGFGGSPSEGPIYTKRIAMNFSTIATPRYVADTRRFRTWNMDPQKVLDDLMIKDVLYEEDRRFVTEIDTLVGAKNTPISDLEACLWIDGGSYTRANIANAFKGTAANNRNIDVARVLVNNLTVNDFIGFADRNSMGGDYAEEMFLSGVIERPFFNVNLLATNKKDLVANNDMYLFGPEEFLGRGHILDQLQMHSDKEAYWLNFWDWETFGLVIGNRAACAKVSFGNSAVSWTTGT